MPTIKDALDIIGKLTVAEQESLNTMLGNTGSFNQQINGLTPNDVSYTHLILKCIQNLVSPKECGVSVNPKSNSSLTNG